jgi:beta-mannosidase
MQSRAMEHHDRQTEGTERLYRFLAEFFRVPAEFEDTVYLMQLMQGEAIKMGVEHWRARKFRTAGALFWQLNDCWPVTSWSCIDCEGRPKALYHYAARFFAPVLPVIERAGDRWSVKIVNDRLEPFEGELICGFGRVSGDQGWVHREPVSVPANAVLEAASKDLADVTPEEHERSLFWCRLRANHQQIAGNVRFGLPCKHMRLDVPEWDVKVESLAPGRFAVALHSDTFAKGVWLRVEGVEARFSDNYFDVLVGVPVNVEVTTEDRLTADELHRRLRVRSVADLY